MFHERFQETFGLSGEIFVYILYFPNSFVNMRRGRPPKKRRMEESFVLSKIDEMVCNSKDILIFVTVYFG